MWRLPRITQRAPRNLGDAPRFSGWLEIASRKVWAHHPGSDQEPSAQLCLVKISGFRCHGTLKSELTLTILSSLDVSSISAATAGRQHLAQTLVSFPCPPSSYRQYSTGTGPPTFI